MATSESKVTLKLLVDTKNQKVLFAEAGKDFVDFLFALLALPLGTVTRLLKENSHGMVGCFGDLYESVQNLCPTYIQEGKNKDLVLKPSFSTSGTPLLLPNAYAANEPNTQCPNSNYSYSNSYGRNVCSSDANNTVGIGFVKGVVTYMVMDSLEVSPMSTISSISLLNKFNVQDLGSLEERVVDFSMAEGLNLLTASLTTKAVLTSVFLRSNAK